MFPRRTICLRMAVRSRNVKGLASLSTQLTSKGRAANKRNKRNKKLTKTRTNAPTILPSTGNITSPTAPATSIFSRSGPEVRLGTKACATSGFLLGSVVLECRFLALSVPTELFLGPVHGGYGWIFGIKVTVSVLYWYEKLSSSKLEIFGKVFGLPGFRLPV